MLPSQDDIGRVLQSKDAVLKNIWGELQRLGSASQDSYISQSSAIWLDGVEMHQPVIPLGQATHPPNYASFPISQGLGISISPEASNLAQPQSTQSLARNTAISEVSSTMRSLQGWAVNTDPQIINPARPHVRQSIVPATPLPPAPIIEKRIEYRDEFKHETFIRGVNRAHNILWLIQGNDEGAPKSVLEQANILYQGHMLPLDAEIVDQDASNNEQLCVCPSLHIANFTAGFMAYLPGNMLICCFCRRPKYMNLDPQRKLTFHPTGFRLPNKDQIILQLYPHFIVNQHCEVVYHGPSAAVRWKQTTLNLEFGDIVNSEIDKIPTHQFLGTPWHIVSQFGGTLRTLRGTGLA